MTKLFLILTLSFLSFRSKAQLEVPPHWKFSKLETAHFEIIFNANQQALAEHYAKSLEHSHKQLSKYFSAFPQKTVIVINDKTDITNGYATRIPYPHIVAFPVLPNSQSSLGDYGSWSNELLGHEYTHILSFEPATGIVKHLRSVFGNIMAPNILLPKWWLEGVAVHMETTISSGGRLRSPYQDAILRAWEVDNKWPQFTIDKANETLPDFPGGMSPYIFGSIFWAQTSASYSNSVIDKLTQIHSGRLPFALEYPSNKILTKTYEEQYNQAIQDVRSRTQRQIETLKQEPPTESQIAKHDLKYSSNPQFAANGEHLAFIGVDRKGNRQIHIISRSNIKSFDLAETHTIVDQEAENIRWSPDSSKLLFDKISQINRYESRSDLWVYNLNTKKSERLTKGLRLREASYSTDGSRIASVQVEPGRTSLVVLNIETQKIDTLLSSDFDERISYPIFKSANEIIFSFKRSGKMDQLYSIDTNSKAIKPLFNEFERSRVPLIFDNKLYFTSTKNGIHNIYESTDYTNSAKPITHTLLGLSHFAFDPITKDLWATEVSGNGLRLIKIENNNLRNLNSPLPSVTSLYSDLYSKPIESNITVTDETIEMKLSDYNARNYLLPQYFIPYVFFSSEGGLAIQALTSAHDPLKKHEYSLGLSYETTTQKINGSLQYMNQTTELPFILGAAQQHSYLGNISNKLTDRIAQFYLLPDIFQYSDKMSVQAGWQFIERSTSSKTVRRAGPSIYWSMESISQGSHEVAPTDSYSVYAGWNSYIKGDSTYLQHNRYLLGGSLYTDKFLPDSHALALKLNAAYTPEKISAAYGVQSEYNFESQILNIPTYVIRGYASGAFFGKTMVSTNIDYQFPIREVYKGSGTKALFIKNISAAITMDALAVDGYAIDKNSKTYVTKLDRTFTSFGLEGRMAINLGYNFPLKLIMGVYSTPNSPDNNPGGAALAIQFIQP